MRLKNKKTGEIVETDLEIKSDDGFGWKLSARNLVELNEEWEDVPEEPKEDYWYITEDGTPGRINLSWDTQESIENHKSIGNYFETYKEAEKAVEKLKAWKRLKDKGFRFTGVYDEYIIKFTAPKEEIGWSWCNGMDKDLDLLFGGEE